MNPNPVYSYTCYVKVLLPVHILREEVLEWILKSVISEGVNWIYLAQHKDQWRAHVNTVSNLRFPRKAGSSGATERLFTSKQRVCSTELMS
jgi:hypothetical protein